MTEKKICKSCGGKLTAMNLLSDPPIPVDICMRCGYQHRPYEENKVEENPTLTLENALHILSTFEHRRKSISTPATRSEEFELGMLDHDIKMLKQIVFRLKGGKGGNK